MRARMMDDHGKLLALAETLDTLVEGDCVDSDRVADCRWTLARLIMQHLTVEEDHVRVTLEHLPLSGAGADGRDLRGGLERLGLMFQDHMRRYPAGAPEGAWAAYGADVRALTEAMRQRIAEEEEALLRLVDRRMAV